MSPNQVRKRLRIGFLLLPVVLIVGKLFPSIVRRIINKKLNAIPYGRGQVESTSISIFNTSITIKNAEFKIIDDSINQTDLTVTVDTVTLKLYRRHLWKGEIVADASIQSPCVSLVKTYHELVIKYLQRSFIADAPITIRKLKVAEGKVEFTNLKTKPQLKAKIEDLVIEGRQLTNVNQPGDKLPAKILITGNAFGGKLRSDIRAGFLENMPAFDVNLSASGVQLVQLNDFFTVYGKFDVSKGIMDLYTEVAASDGKFKGYVKPLIRDLQILSREDLKKGFFNFIWESLLAAGSSLVENRSKDQIASKIPFEGTFKSAKINTWAAIGEALMNAFVQGLRPSFDLDINIRSVRRAV